MELFSQLDSNFLKFSSILQLTQINEYVQTSIPSIQMPNKLYLIYFHDDFK
jgi:hypothetical protein